MVAAGGQRVKNEISQGDLDAVVKSCQKEVLRMNVYQSEMDDVCSHNMSFLQNAIRFTHRLNQQQLVKSCVDKLGMPQDDAKMYSKQMVAALSHVMSKSRKAFTGKRLHPAVRQIMDVGNIEMGKNSQGSGERVADGKLSASESSERFGDRSRTPSRSFSTAATFGETSPRQIYKAYGVKAPVGLPLGTRILKPMPSEAVSVASSASPVKDTIVYFGRLPLTQIC